MKISSAFVPGFWALATLVVSLPFTGARVSGRKVIRVLQPGPPNTGEGEIPTGEEEEEEPQEPLVTLEFWTSPRYDWAGEDGNEDGPNIAAMEALKEVEVGFGPGVLFDMNVYVNNGDGVCPKEDVEGTPLDQKTAKKICDDSCANKRRYCEPPPVDPAHMNDVTGKMIIAESLRRQCLWNVFHDNENWDDERKLFDYLYNFHDRRCDTKYFRELCITNVLKLANIKGDLMKQCIVDSGGVEKDKKNTVFETQLAKQKERKIDDLDGLPAVFINGELLQADISSPNLFAAICSHIPEYERPEELCADVEEVLGGDEDPIEKEEAEEELAEEIAEELGETPEQVLGETGEAEEMEEEAEYDETTIELQMKSLEEQAAADAGVNPAEKMVDQVQPVIEVWTTPLLDWDLATDAGDGPNMDLFAALKEVVVGFGDRIIFHPLPYVFTTQQVCTFDEDMNPILEEEQGDCADLHCGNNRRYCSVGPDDWLVTGVDMVEESLRRMCVWELYGRNEDRTDDGVFFEYLTKFHEGTCDNTEVRDECITNALSEAGITVEAVKGCMEQSGGLTEDKENNILQSLKTLQNMTFSLRDMDVTDLPIVLIDGVPLPSDEPATLDGIFEAICKKYPAEVKPGACQEGYLENLGENFGANVSAPSADITANATAYASNATFYDFNATANLTTFGFANSTLNFTTGMNFTTNLTGNGTWWYGLNLTANATANITTYGFANATLNWTFPYNVTLNLTNGTATNLTTTLTTGNPAENVTGNPTVYPSPGDSAIFDTEPTSAVPLGETSGAPLSGETLGAPGEEPGSSSLPPREAEPPLVPGEEPASESPVFVSATTTTESPLGETSLTTTTTAPLDIAAETASSHAPVTINSASSVAPGLDSTTASLIATTNPLSTTTTSTPVVEERTQETPTPPAPGEAGEIANLDALDATLVNTAAANMEVLQRCNVDTGALISRLKALGTSGPLKQEFDSIEADLPLLMSQTCPSDEGAKILTKMEDFHTCALFDLKELIETLPSTALGVAMRCANAYSNMTEAEEATGFVPEACIRTLEADSTLGRGLFALYLYPDVACPCFEKLGTDMPECTADVWPIPINGVLVKTQSCLVGQYCQAIDGLCEHNLNVLSQCLPPMGTNPSAINCEDTFSKCHDVYDNVPPMLNAAPLPDACVRVAEGSKFYGQHVVERYNVFRHQCGQNIELWEGHSKFAEAKAFVESGIKGIDYHSPTIIFVAACGILAGIVATVIFIIVRNFFICVCNCFKRCCCRSGKKKNKRPESKDYATVDTNGDDTTEYRD